MALFAIFITIIYVLLIGTFIFGFYKVNEYNITSKKAVNNFTVLVAFRNEAKNLPDLLKSISKLQYPKEQFEILLVNDDSKDDFKSIIDTFKLENNTINLKVIDNQRKSNSPKKDAIEEGVKHSKFDWILTTDADCLLTELWLQSYDSFIETNNPYLIAGPVSFKNPTSFLELFQLLDFSALIGCTIGSFGIKKPIMCNGANLCYRKDIFLKLNGFEGNNHLASGDDIFLLEKINAHYPGKAKYLKSRNALVRTTSEPTLKKLIQQRIRWASKSSSYNNRFAKIISLIVFFANLMFVLMMIRVLVVHEFILPLTLKIIVDFITIWVMLQFLENRKPIIWYPIIAVLHPLFIILISLQTLFSKNYQWKKRNFIMK